MRKTLTKNIMKKCDICRRQILINEHRFGSCDYCGWSNSEAALENPNEVLLSNFVSFNRARTLHTEGKPIIPNFEEFMEVLYQYGEMQFDYLGRTFGVIRGDVETGRNIDLFDVNKSDSYVKFFDYDDFRQNAKIDDKPLRDIWNEVIGVNFLQ